MTENTNATAGPLYPKIPGVWKREIEGPRRNQLIEGAWTSRELELTAGLYDWNLSEKADGTNVRIGWTGYEVVFGGRTDKAQMPPALDEYLRATFVEELFEQQFGETPVTVYSEGIGPKIQSGGLYGETRAVIFDVRIGNMWLLRPDVEDIASALGVGVVPLVDTAVTLLDGIEIVRRGLYSEIAAEQGNSLLSEGLVATLASGMLDRRGQRIQTKLKHKDLT
jgi:hypothetical protein